MNTNKANQEKFLSNTEEIVNLQIKSSTPFEGFGKVIAERINYSKRHIPHALIHDKVDITRLINLIKSIKNTILLNYKIEINYIDFLLKACALALREHLEVNSSLQKGNYIIYEDINIGLGIFTGKGLKIYNIYDCDKLSIFDISKTIVELLKGNHKENKKIGEKINSTFTLVNLGMYDINSFSPIINSPQAASLGVGKIYQGIGMINRDASVRSFIELSLSIDHRIINGALGTTFLKKVVNMIENPEMLFMNLRNAIRPSGNNVALK